MRYKLIMRSGVSTLNDYEVGLFYDKDWAHHCGVLILREDAAGPHPEYITWEVIDLESF